MSMEARVLPHWIDYENIVGLSNEAVERLKNVRPQSLGQASRIPGVSPADISVLVVYLEQQRRKAGDTK